jgi:hypothetical protein
MNTIDWDKVPEQYKWVAADWCGMQYAYVTEPYIDSGRTAWREKSEDYLYVGTTSYEDYDWKESLVQRPSKQPIAEVGTYAREDVLAFLDNIVGRGYTLQSVDTYLADRSAKTEEEQSAIKLLEGMGYNVSKEKTCQNS